MTLKVHKKHAAITRPAFGNFGRNELGIVGAPCGDIQQLARKIIAALQNEYQLAYVDARHDDEPETTNAHSAQGAAITYTGKGNSQTIDLNSQLNTFQHRRLFNSADLVLVNGNHYQAKQQVVIINGRKEQSLQKRLAQLTDVRLFLLAEGETEVFDFIKAAIPNWHEIPVLSLDETENIISLIKTQLQEAAPVLNGLVLAGSKSERMGTDKGAINWHGQPQVYHAANMLKPFCTEVFISCRPEQQANIDSNYPALIDTFTGLGPYGAILSAFREKPDSAWLVIACDLPLLDQATLQQLVAARRVKNTATTFKSPYDDFPEPLITIWEPKSYPELLSFLAQGYSCARKVLINSDACIIDAENPDALTNVNTPEELARVQSILQQKV